MEEIVLDSKFMSRLHTSERAILIKQAREEENNENKQYQTKNKFGANQKPLQYVFQA